jgi:transposase
MKKPSQHLIAEVPWKRGQVELTIGIDLGDVGAITALSTSKAK